MRILHLIEGLGGLGGAERRLINDITRLNGKFTHAVGYLYSDDHFAPLLRERGIPVTGLGLSGPADPRTPFRLSGLIRRVRPDLIHTQLFGADFAGRLMGGWMSIPVCSTVQSSVYDSPEPFLVSRKQRWVDGWTARHCVRRLVAVSRFVRTSLIRHLGVPEAKITVIPNAIDPEPYGTDRTAQAAALRAAHSIPDRELLFLTVGKLNPAKGHRHLIEAFARYLSRGREGVLAIIGEGPCREALKRQAQAAGVADRIRWLGARSDVPDWMAACDLFLFPSVSEGLPFVLLEAMASAKPCVAFSIGPMGEVVESGTTGLL
ncbi:MAG: hypothetical protein COV76_04240, partial [Candidatus Omnitrophica bacterium CG11_big_fil_rev_8_21_14_0_20_64_10]